MPLVNDLIAQVQQKIITFQGGGVGGQQQVRDQYLSFVALAPNGLQVISRISIDATDFATTIDAHRAELRPWIMVYPAALGLSAGPWMTILTAWAYATIANPAQIPPVIDEMIKSLVSGYTRLIAL